MPNKKRSGRNFQLAGSLAIGNMQRQLNTVSNRLSNLTTRTTASVSNKNRKTSRKSNAGKVFEQGTFARRLARGTGKYSGTGETLRFCETEFWSALQGNSQFESLVFRPGQSGLSRLDQIALLFDQYRLEKCVIRYTPDVGTSSVGRVIIGVDYVPDRLDLTERQIEVLQPRIAGAAWMDGVMSIDVTRAMKAKWHYVAGGINAGGSATNPSVLNDVLQSAFTLQCFSDLAGHSAGRVWVDYEVVFIGPTATNGTGIANTNTQIPQAGGGWITNSYVSTLNAQNVLAVPIVAGKIGSITVPSGAYPFGPINQGAFAGVTKYGSWVLPNKSSSIVQSYVVPLSGSSGAYTNFISIMQNPNGTTPIVAAAITPNALLLSNSNITRNKVKVPPGTTIRCRMEWIMSPQNNQADSLAFSPISTDNFGGSTTGPGLVDLVSYAPDFIVLNSFVSSGQNRPADTSGTFCSSIWEFDLYFPNGGNMNQQVLDNQGTNGFLNGALPFNSLMLVWDQSYTSVGSTGAELSGFSMTTSWFGPAIPTYTP